MIEAGELESDVQGQPISADALHLPFPNGTFDKIICSEVLEHIDDDKTALTELVRVCDQGDQLR